MKIRFRFLFALVLLSGPAVAPSWALTDAEAAAGRAILKKYSDAVVAVELVVTFKISNGSGSTTPRELKREINGTVISKEGLTVISLGEIDPRGSLGGQTSVRIEDPDFKEVKLRLADGTEVPGQIVLKDADLDLAFVAPLTDPAATRVYPFVNLDEACDPVVLGTYYHVSRTPKLQQRAAVVLPINVIGVIEKPRRLILSTSYSLSCPAFDGQGKVLGICLRNISGGQQAGFIIIPASDIAETAKQAAAIKPEAVAPAAAEPAVSASPAAMEKTP
jgi:hypothetical protein